MRTTYPISMAYVIGLATGLTATWLTLYSYWPISFWATNNDYVYLSLAHAIHFETSLHSSAKYYDAALYVHPGLPFYIVSWLSLRAGALFYGNGDLVQSVLSSPDIFFLATRIAAGLITSVAIVAAWLLLRGLSAPWRLVAILSFFATTSASFRYGLMFLSNETFALPLACSLFWAVDLLARTSPRANWPWVLLGSVAAAGYVVKLLYLDMLVAAAAVASIDSWWASPRLGWSLVLGFLRRIILLTVTFAIVAAFVVIAAIGRNGLAELLRFHASVFTHSGMYGTGNVGFLSSASVHRALVAWFETAMPYLLVLVILALFVTMWNRRRSATIDRFTILWVAAAMASLASSIAAVLKHFESHYVVAISAILPFFLFTILEQRRTRLIAAAGIIGSFLFTAFEAGREFHQESRDAIAVAEDEATIANMPLLPTEARLWTYRVPSEKFAAAFVATYSGLPPLIKTLADPARLDLSSYSRVERSYRYLILERKRYPDADTVRKTKDSLEPTQAIIVHAEAHDQIHVLQQLIVVEKPAH